MAETKKPSNGRTSIIVGTICSILGAVGSPLVLVRLSPDLLRPDPYTATMAKEAHDKLEQDITYHVQNHPDVALRNAISELRAGAAAAKAERTLILRNQDRILERIDHLSE